MKPQAYRQCMVRTAPTRSRRYGSIVPVAVLAAVILVASGVMVLDGQGPAEDPDQNQTEKDPGQNQTVDDPVVRNGSNQSYMDIVLLVDDKRYPRDEQGESRLLLLQHDGQYRVGANVSMERAVSVTRADQELFAATNDSIGRIDRNLTMVDRQLIPKTEALHGHNGRLYAVANGTFHVLDTELNTLGQVDILPTNKNVHDILVHDGIAYLVDNAINPKYLLRVDVSDPANPEHVGTHEVTGTGQTLGSQWLDPANRQWYVLQEESHMGGTSQNVLIRGMDGAAQGSDTIHTHSRSNGSMSGTKITDTTRYPPIWATAIRDGTTQLVRVTADDGPLPRINGGDDMMHLDPVMALNGTTLKRYSTSLAVIGNDPLHAQFINPQNQTVLYDQRLNTSTKPVKDIVTLP